MESIAEDTEIDANIRMNADIRIDVDATMKINFRLADYYPSLINPILYQSGKNLKLIQNIESLLVLKK